ncbi:MAG: deoxyguanosinetriphosphate triphosphohydrolase [Phycisphaerae bacterium]|nr:deoxyguanosinetriphosphate triphosphohydrolase [Phycisphaerae bacterium]
MRPSRCELAPYAVDPLLSRGRAHLDPLDDLRRDFELDRYRVIHCMAFHRLAYKTQVFVAHEGDHYRTRLTHSLEVADLAADLALALRVNVQLAEVVALAHDLGHTPFGHAGESALNERMSEHGGFEHNRQSVRVVEYLEHPYPAFRGLNLMTETLECMAAHATQYDHPDGADLQVPVEGQITNVADRLAYDAHDLEDALGAGLIDGKDLSGLRLWWEAAAPIRREFAASSVFAVRRPILDVLIRNLLADVSEESNRRIQELAPVDADDVRGAGRILVRPSDDMEERLRELERFLFENVYRHPRVVEVDDRARRLVRETFDAFLSDPTRLPSRFADRIEEQGRHRVVCDYVAGMTDRFIETEHRRLCG